MDPPFVADATGRRLYSYIIVSQEIHGGDPGGPMGCEAARRNPRGSIFVFHE